MRRSKLRWYLLLIPACLLSVLALTNDLHHFFYYIMPEESQPNLYFHPYIGTYIVYIWGLSIISYQVYVIYRRNGTTKSDSLYRKLIPFYEPILLLLFSIPYATTAYVVRFELVEYSAGLIFICEYPSEGLNYNSDINNVRMWIILFLYLKF